MTQARRSSRLLYTVCAISLLFASSCQKKDSDKVAEAQACLDKATADTALACMDKVSGVEGEAADMIRCSANFIYQKFADPLRLSRIADQMKSGAGTSSASMALALLSFSRPDDAGAKALAVETSKYCVSSKSKGMILLSQMALVGSTMAAAVAGLAQDCDASSATYDATTCHNQVVAAACQADAATLGTAALTAYQQSCQGSSQADSSVCQQFAQVTAGQTDPTTIGEGLQTQLNDGTTCP